MMQSRRELIEDIAAWLGKPIEQVESIWVMEEQELGHCVRRDVEAFGVTPHVYDLAMERLYRDGEGFVFETLCYWNTTNRQSWTLRGLERLNRYCNSRGIQPKDLRLLMLGDGSGSDTLFLAEHGYRPHYFDVPGSRTSSFARFRFRRTGRADKVTTIERYEQLLGQSYDAVWSFDVLEHLPSLEAAIDDLGKMLAMNGVVMMTESCRYVRPDLPTHLSINRKYHGLIPALMRRAGLYIHWYAEGTDFRPVEYLRLPRWHLGQRFASLRLERRAAKQMRCAEDRLERSSAGVDVSHEIGVWAHAVDMPDQ